MLATILIVVTVAIVVLIIIFAARQPDEFRVTRSAMLPVAPSMVFPHVNDLRKWDAWSPWAKLDPIAKNSFEGPFEGAGACVRWVGNKNVGEGSMTIIESRPHELVRFRLEFLKPMKATNTADFIFKPQGDQTQITWSMYGPNNFMGKLVGLVMNCEKMVGGQFEDGLASLKAVTAAGK